MPTCDKAQTVFFSNLLKHAQNVFDIYDGRIHGDLRSTTQSGNKEKNAPKSCYEQVR